MIQLIYGTSNPAKLSAMKSRLSELDIDIIGLKDLDEEIPEVIEDGKTPLENARIKALAYYNKFKKPVFSCDSGLYFEDVPDEVQPGVHVRNVNGKHLTDQEMIKYYSGLAKEYGGLKARYRNAIVLIMDEDHVYEAMEENMASEPFFISEYPHKERKEGFPLDSLSIDVKTGKYYYDLEKDELDVVAVEEGFIEFFENIFGDNKEQDNLKISDKKSKKKTLLLNIVKVLLVSIIAIIFIFIYKKDYYSGYTDDVINLNDFNYAHDEYCEGNDYFGYVFEEGEHTVKCVARLTNQNRILKRVDTVIDGNSAFVTLVTRNRKKNEHAYGDAYFDVNLPSGVDTLYIQGVLFWQRGRSINRLTKNIYNAKCEKASDLDKNKTKIWDIIKMNEVFSISNYSCNDDTNEVVFDIDDKVIYEELFKSIFKGYASVILSCVNDLEKVSCNYNFGGTKKQYTVSCDDATKMLHRDIKKFSEKYCDLQDLVAGVCCEDSLTYYYYFDINKDYFFDDTNNLFYDYSYEEYKINSEEAAFKQDIEDNGVFLDYLSFDNLLTYKNRAINYEYLSRNNFIYKINNDTEKKKMTINFNQNIYCEEVFINAIKSYAYMNFALIDGLDTIDCKYTTDSQKTITINRENIMKVDNSKDFQKLLEDVYAYHYFGHCTQSGY